MIKDGIMEITPEVGLQIVRSAGPEGEGEYKPIGKFWDKEGDIYVGIDNSTGDCWVEDFKTKSACIKWLKGGKES